MVADALARLAVCAAEARAALLACGLDDVSDASVAGAIADADAELEASVAANTEIMAKNVKLLDEKYGNN